MEIIDKRIVVTGAASGIGEALCKAFKDADAKSVVAVDINLEGAEVIAKEIEGLAVSANVAKEEDIKRLKNIQLDLHKDFIDVVEESRGNKLKKNLGIELFTGEFWSGKKAKEFG